MTTGRARSKLQRLLRELDVGQGAELAEAAGGPAGSSPAAGTAAVRRQRGSDQRHGGGSGSEGSSRSDCSDDFDSDGGANRGGSNDDGASSLGDDTVSFSDSAAMGAARGGRQHLHGAPPGVLSKKYLELERRAVQLMHDNRMLQASHGQYVKRSELELAEVKEGMRKALAEMEARQREVEARAPLAASRLEDYKGRLQELRISEAQYQELKSMPAGGTHILDQVKISIYEQTRELSRESEQLRLSLQTSRQSCGRLEEEVARLRAESARAGASLVEKDKEHQERLDGYNLRVQRLTAELEQALMRAELNSAKGSMYDELRSKAEALETENRRLLVAEATLRRLEAEHADAEAAHRAREHGMEMLHMDKAYLAKQVEFMDEQARKLHGELEASRQQCSELRRKHDALMEKLADERGGRARSDEARVQQELARLKESTHADVERMRAEAAEGHERESRLLRQMRDESAEEAARYKAAHEALKDLHERHVASTAEAQRRLEGQAMELQAELRHKAFELGHLRVVLGEKEGLLGQANMQLDMVQEKVAVLRERCATLEADALAAAAAAPQRPPGVPAAAALPPALTVQHSVAGGTAALAAHPASAPSSHHAEALAALRAEKRHLEARLERASKKLADAEELLALVGQPHAFALEKLGEANARCEELSRDAGALRSLLASRSADAERAALERDALRADLDALLTQRAALDAMKAAVVRALGGGGGGGGGGALPGGGVVAGGGGGGALTLHGQGALPGATTAIL